MPKFRPTLFFFLTLAKILWTHATHAKIPTHATHAIFLTHTKILWAHATHVTHESTYPRYPHHPRYLADSLQYNMKQTMYFMTS